MSEVKKGDKCVAGWYVSCIEDKCRAPRNRYDEKLKQCQERGK